MIGPHEDEDEIHLVCSTFASINHSSQSVELNDYYTVNKNH